MQRTADQQQRERAPDVAMPSALMRQEATVVSANGQPAADLLAKRTLALPMGTLHVAEGRFESPTCSVALSPQQRRLAAALADGEWHDAASLEAALYPKPVGPSRLQSALARLRHTLGGGIASDYGGGWRLEVLGLQRTNSTLLDLLDHAPTPPNELQQALGCSAGALRARIYRLRRSGVPVAFGDGGYALAYAPDSPHQALVDALRAHPVVNLWGPIGVGKSTLLRRVGGQGVLNLYGLSPRILARRLDALSKRPPSMLYLDEVREPEVLLERLEPLRAAGHRIVFATRWPCEDIRQVAYPPWAPARLQQRFPDHDTADWDGLPIGQCGDAEILARIELSPALRTAAEPLGEARLQRVALERLRALGVLVGSEPARLAGPVRRAVRSTWSADDCARNVQAFDAHLERLFMDQQHQPKRALLLREGLELLEIAEGQGLPVVELLCHLFDAQLFADVERFQRALQTTRDPDLRVNLWYRLWIATGGEHEEAFIHAIGEASEPLAHEFNIELAYELHTRDQASSDRLFAETWRWLQAQPPEAQPWIRNEWLVSRVLLEPRTVEPRVLIEQILMLERTRFTQPPKRLLWMRIQALAALGTCALSHDEIDIAVTALEEVAVRLGPESADRGGLDLLVAYVRREDWEAAEAHWKVLQQAELSDPWDGARRNVRALMLLGQGRLVEARKLCEGLDPAHHFVARLAEALAGTEPNDDDPNYELLETVQRAVLSGDPADLQAVQRLPAGRFTSGSLLVRLIAARQANG